MIIKYPLFLILLFPIIGLIVFFKNIQTTHTIKFPKAAWMTSLASKKASRMLKAYRFIQAITLILIIITLAQPQLRQTENQTIKKGIDIVAILDTSGSMNAEDFKPKNRMEVAKETLAQFIKKRSNDRVGLVIFGTDAITKSPMTIDHRIISNQIGQINVGDAGDGTAIGLAIATGMNRLETSKVTSKIMILITDGVNNAGQIDPISAAKLAKKKNIKIYTIGIGDEKGAPIPIYHPTYGKRYARYPNGQLVLTEFNDDVLKEIAQITDAQYFNAVNSDELKSIYKEIDSLEKTIINTSKNYIVFDIFPFLIGMLIILILIRESLALSSLIGVKT